jgi:hypothetical protein
VIQASGEAGAAGLPFADQVHISPEALGLALGLSLLSSILFGLAPAIYSNANFSTTTLSRSADAWR